MTIKSFCPFCGKENESANNKFCNYCGEMIQKQTKDEPVPIKKAKKHNGVFAALIAIIFLLVIFLSITIFALINGTENIPIAGKYFPNETYASKDDDSYDTSKDIKGNISERVINTEDNIYNEENIITENNLHMQDGLSAESQSNDLKNNQLNEFIDMQPDTYVLALVTDIGTIDDKSYNQGSWEGLEKYAKEKNITHKYYQPTELSDDAYLTGIELAVKGGAKLIVTPGFLFETPVYLAQDIYPDTYFVLIDGNPHDAAWSTWNTGPKTVGITYAEQQSGFLAGYAAVKDGYTKLGFMGGMAVPAVKSFGFGFIQGADYAAKEMGLGDGAVTLNYHYTGDFAATPENQAMAASWYNSGVEVIFACGGAVGNSVMTAAEAAGAKVIGVDVDQSSESATVITSAMKGLGASVYAAVKAYHEGSFPGGQNLVFDASNDGVGLPMATSKFRSFSQADYDAIFAKLANFSVTVVGAAGANSVEETYQVPVSAAVVVTEI